jgi:hypothetical protein
MPPRARFAAQLELDLTNPLDVLNLGLANEQMEVAFYGQALESFSEQDFVDAGYSAEVVGRFEQIRDNEVAHVEILTQAIQDLGGEPIEGLEFDFGAALNDVASFVAQSQIFENNDVGALEGMAPFLQGNPDLLTTGLNIHSVEARQAAYVNGLNGVSPFPAATDTPLTPEQVLEAISPFIVS